MKNNQHIDKEEVNRLVQEKLEEWHQKHIAKIEMKYGNTYISYGICDDIAYKGMYKLQKLSELMGLEYLVYVPFGEEKENDRCYISIKGEDQERTTFIQKFIDNGYKLSWR